MRLLSPTERHILSILVIANKLLTFQQLQDKTGYSRTTLTKIINRLPQFFFKVHTWKTTANWRITKWLYLIGVKDDAVEYFQNMYGNDDIVNLTSAWPTVHVRMGGKNIAISKKRVVINGKEKRNEDKERSNKSTMGYVAVTKDEQPFVRRAYNAMKTTGLYDERIIQWTYLNAYRQTQWQKTDFTQFIKDFFDPFTEVLETTLLHSITDVWLEPYHQPSQAKLAYQKAFL